LRVKFFSSNAKSALLGIDPSKINDDRLYRALETMEDRYGKSERIWVGQASTTRWIAA